MFLVKAEHPLACPSPVCSPPPGLKNTAYGWSSNVQLKRQSVIVCHLRWGTQGRVKLYKEEFEIFWVLVPSMGYAPIALSLFYPLKETMRGPIDNYTPNAMFNL